MWVKTIYTDKGKLEFLKLRPPKYFPVDYDTTLYLFDYNGLKYRTSKEIYYSKSDKVLISNEHVYEWSDIPPDTVNDILFNRIIKDYNIKR